MQHERMILIAKSELEEIVRTVVREEINPILDPADPEPGEEEISRKEVCELLGIKSLTTLNNYMRTGKKGRDGNYHKLKYTRKYQNGHPTFLRSDVVEFRERVMG